MIVLVGNKSDLVEQRTVAKEDGQEFAEQYASASVARQILAACLMHVWVSIACITSGVTHPHACIEALISNRNLACVCPIWSCMLLVTIAALPVQEFHAVCRDQRKNCSLCVSHI